MRETYDPNHDLQGIGLVEPGRRVREGDRGRKGTREGGMEGGMEGGREGGRGRGREV